MRALAINSKGVEVVDRPDPEPEPTGVVVTVQACGICGSDVHMAGSSHLEGFVPGHEFSGTITALGDLVRDYAIGDHVAVDQLGSCGHCEACAKGLPFLCQAIPNIGVSRQGAFAEQIALLRRDAEAEQEGGRPCQQAGERRVEQAIKTVESANTLLRVPCVVEKRSQIDTADLRQEMRHADKTAENTVTIETVCKIAIAGTAEKIAAVPIFASR